MTLESDAIDLASRNLMLVGFSIALVAAVLRRKWAFVLILPLAIYETVHPNRYAFHSWMRDELIGTHPPTGAKEALQSQLMYVGTMLAIAMLLLLLPYLMRANSGRRLVFAGSLCVLAILSLELVSPHKIDLIISQPVGGIALAAIVYFTGSLVFAAGALLDRRT